MTESEELKDRLAEITQLETKIRKMLTYQTIREIYHVQDDTLLIVLDNGIKLVVTEILEAKP